MSFAGTPVVVKDSEDRYFLNSANCDLLVDPTGAYSIQDIIAPKAQANFHSAGSEDIIRKGNVSWIRFRLDNRSPQKNWMVKFYDFTIDEIRLYIPNGKGGYSEKVSGYAVDFGKREYLVRNHVFDLNIEGDTNVYYARIKSSNPVELSFGIYKTPAIFEVSLREYFILALFYGTMAALILYNLLFFATLKSREYLFYVLYGISAAAFAATEDGTGFQYLWPGKPVLNEYIFSIALCFMTVWSLFYAKSFFSIRRSNGLIYYLFIGVILFRVLVFISGIVFFPSVLRTPWPEFIPFLFMVGTGIYYWKRGTRVSIYFLMAQLFFLFWYVVDSMNLFPVSLFNNFFNLFGFNIGVITQLILFSFALAERIRDIDRQKQLIEQRNRELDTFVYKVSHDLKGPLKSIIGLTTLGMQDQKTQEARTYFDMILKNTKRLDAILADLVLITKVKQKAAQKEWIDFDALITEILASFQYYPSFHEMDFKVEIHGVAEVYSDRGLLYSVFQNIIENAIKYKKPSNSPLFEDANSKSFLHIEVLKGPTHTEVIFSDNGLGIPAEYQEKIFDMFFRIETDISGTGLGLYLVKMSIEKLGGKIGVESKEREGTTFTIELPNE